VATLQCTRSVSGRDLPDPCKSRTLSNPKRRPFHGVARSVADCVNRNLSCTACVCPLTVEDSVTHAAGARTRASTSAGAAAAASALLLSAAAASDRSPAKRRRTDKHISSGGGSVSGGAELQLCVCGRGCNPSTDLSKEHGLSDDALCHTSTTDGAIRQSHRRALAQSIQVRRRKHISSELAMQVEQIVHQRAAAGAAVSGAASRSALKASTTWRAAHVKVSSV